MGRVVTVEIQVGRVTITPYWRLKNVAMFAYEYSEIIRLRQVHDIISILCNTWRHESMNTSKNNKLIKQ